MALSFPRRRFGIPYHDILSQATRFDPFAQRPGGQTATVIRPNGGGPAGDWSRSARPATPSAVAKPVVVFGSKNALRWVIPFGQVLGRA